MQNVTCILTLAFAAFATSFIAAPALAQNQTEPKQESQQKAVQKKDKDLLEDALKQAGKNRGEFEKLLTHYADNSAGTKAARFLIENMPQNDLESFSAKFLIDNIDFAEKARKTFPWCSDIPEEIYLNDVLPYASVNERRDRWRKDFFDRFSPLVKDCKTASEAAQVLNQKMFGIVKVKYSTKRKKPDQSPYESMEQGLASCTGLSVLLTDACRSVGVPARLVGTPLWVNKRGNHTWVEIWDKKWHFTGACEYDKNGLNRGWFTGIASQADSSKFEHRIYATSFKKDKLHFPMVWAWRNKTIGGVDVTSRYTEKVKSAENLVEVYVDVYPSKGKDRIKARVKITQDGKSIMQGMTRTPAEDTNDRLTFDLEPGKTYQLKIKLENGKSFQVDVKNLKNENHQLLNIMADEYLK